jgi:L-amino acid N-acyltransferase YncA
MASSNDISNRDVVKPRCETRLSSAESAVDSSSVPVATMDDIEYVPGASATSRVFQEALPPKVRPSHRPKRETHSSSLGSAEEIRANARLRIDRKIAQQRQDDKGTTSLKLLYEVREPMQHAKFEEEVQERVKMLRLVGENPQLWSAGSDADDSPIESTSSDNQETRERTAKTDSDNKAKTKNNSTATPLKEHSGNIPSNGTKGKSRRNSRWATACETRAEPQKVDSNAWGSVGADDGWTDAAELNKVVGEGRHELVGWDGKMLAPPVDWELRPRMRPYRRDEQDDFSDALDEVFHSEYPPLSFHVIPNSMLMDLSLQADGLGMVPRTTRIAKDHLFNRYGYPACVRDKEELQWLKDQAVTITEHDFDMEPPRPNDWLQDQDYQDTTELYSQRALAILRKFKARQPTPEPETIVEEPNPNTPILNIYLRPASAADVPQMTAIYNWHLTHGPRITELELISETDMQERLDVAKTDKLTIVVAVKKVKSRTKKRRPTPNAASASHPINNTNPTYQGMVMEEELVGWAGSLHLTAPEFVERTTAEIEIYVAAEARQMGVGRCLMDKMLQICDRGYILRGGYDFHCLPEIAHLYSEGGGRDFHKVCVVVRAWSFPRAGECGVPMEERKGKGKANTAMEKKADQEDEYDVWLKGWLESWGFEQEGRLREAGVRDGRYLDIIQLGRLTMYAPQDGHYPPRLIY